MATSIRDTCDSYWYKSDIQQIGDAIMSMDDQYREMKVFKDALIDFNARLKASVQDLQKNHDHISPHWQDEMRRHYDAQWLPLHDVMSHYIHNESRDYVEFLHIKIHALERYMYGG